MNDALTELLQYLEVEQIDKYIFIGHSPEHPRRVFGGQVLAQGINAALRTADTERRAHSLHGYFLRPGDPSKQIVYEVDPIRDGGSFTTRRIVAKQDGIAIFNMAVSMHIQEQGFSHQSTMPDVPPPEEVECDDTVTRRLVPTDEDIFTFLDPRAIEKRSLYHRDYHDPQPAEPVQYIWLRATGDLGDDTRRHQTLLAYISDLSLVGVALRPHPYAGHSSGIQLASLDHAMWFHRDFRMDEYVLYALDSPNAYGNRGFGRGSFYTRDGTLVASAAQESLLRPIEE